MSIMGTRVVRTEDPKLLTVGGTYVDDVRVPELTGAARVTFVRSPLGHPDVVHVGPADGQQLRVFGPHYPGTHDAHCDLRGL